MYKRQVLTGVGYAPEKTGVVVYENGEMRYYEHDKISKGCHGTGDIYALSLIHILKRKRDEYGVTQ